MLQDDRYLGLQEEESLVPRRKQKTEQDSARPRTCLVLGHVWNDNEEAAAWKGILPHPLYPRCTDALMTPGASPSLDLMLPGREAVGTCRAGHLE